jgi:hypothetical protein
MTQTTNNSEVAHIRAAIVAEHEAAQRALYSLAAGTNRHAFITAKQQRIGEHFQRLAAIVGDEQKAIAIVADTLKDVEVGRHATP